MSWRCTMIRWLWGLAVSLVAVCVVCVIWIGSAGRMNRFFRLRAELVDVDYTVGLGGLVAAAPDIRLKRKLSARRRHLIRTSVPNGAPCESRVNRVILSE